MGLHQNTAVNTRPELWSSHHVSSSDPFGAQTQRCMFCIRTQRESEPETDPTSGNPFTFDPHLHRKWLMTTRRGPDLHPSPATEGEEPGAFVLDLRNFPDLANAYVGSQNPNIQVTIEVMEDSQTEVEMDLAKENQRSDWSVSPSEWMSRKLFWPLFWESGLAGTGPEDYGYAPADAVLGGVGADGWTRRAEKQNEEWSDWAPCSTTCGPGSQKRTRSCGYGYGCTATESRTCDLDSCSSKTQTSLGRSDPLGCHVSHSGVDSCEKWLSCRNDFLQKYLHQVLTQLPSCPCSYPSEAVYGAISIPDRRLRRTYRWRDASGPKERLDVYKPSARFCVRSMLSYDGPTLGAHCSRTRRETEHAGSDPVPTAELIKKSVFEVDLSSTPDKVLVWSGFPCRTGPAGTMEWNEVDLVQEFTVEGQCSKIKVRSCRITWDSLQVPQPGRVGPAEPAGFC
uniref:AMOP domain-containing protein n=1 Tax=Xiphophorus couchianus TaxID=32473 RepID=A0A3B5KRU0_9TELE